MAHATAEAEDTVTSPCSDSSIETWRRRLGSAREEEEEETLVVRSESWEVRGVEVEVGRQKEVVVVAAAAAGQRWWLRVLIQLVVERGGVMVESSIVID